VPSGPSIKGVLFARAVEEVRALRDAGTIAPGDLRRWLRPEDLPLLEEPPLSTGWYDVGAYGRLCLLLRDVAGGGEDAFLRELGAWSAGKLIESGRYPQLQYVERTEVASAGPAERFDAFGRDLRIFASFGTMMLSGSRCVVRPVPGQRRYVLELETASDLPEPFLWRLDGFVNEIARRHGTPDLWTWSRRGPGVVELRMVREL
jgi:hypothetical protein